MKTLILPALVALGMFVSSGCEKDENIFSGSESTVEPVVNNKTIEQLLRETDAKFGTNYSLGYGKGINKIMGTDVRITPGIYYIPKGQPANAGYCLPHPTNPCHIEITMDGNAVVKGGNTIQEQSMDVILNSQDSPELIRNVKEVIPHEVLDANGNLLYTLYEYVR